MWFGLQVFIQIKLFKNLKMLVVLSWLRASSSDVGLLRMTSWREFGAVNDDVFDCDGGFAYVTQWFGFFGDQIRVS